MNKPKFVKIDNELYEINTDFRVALKCNEISMDTNIGNLERFLATIYLLFGDKGMDCKDQNKLYELGIKYISLGRDENSFKMDSDSKYELDFKKCEGLIKSSFKFDYNYDPYELEYLHWYDFYTDLENLSTSEFGNCCIVNRIINILNQDTSKIKDSKEKKKIVEAQKRLAEKYCMKKEKEITEEQEKSVEEFYSLLNINKKGG